MTVARHGIEPFDAKVLTDYLHARGAEFDGAAGNHGTFRLPNGDVVKAPNKGQVTKLTVKAVAAQLGMPYGSLRAALGHPIAKAGKPRQKRAEPPKSAGKSDVLRTIRETRSALHDIEQVVKQGQRDSSFYRRILGDLIEASPLIASARRQST
jgi:hypothetical protein